MGPDLSPLPSEDLFGAHQWELAANCCCRRMVQLGNLNIGALLQTPRLLATEVRRSCLPPAWDEGLFPDAVVLR